MKLLSVLSALFVAGLVAARIEITITEHSDNINVKYNDYREQPDQDLDILGKDKGPRCRRRDQECSSDDDCCKNLVCRRGGIIPRPGEPLPSPFQHYCR